MKNWKKGILGVALSFMFLFTCIGYAALTDTLSITGTVSATMPEEIFISEIELLEGSAIASISDLRQITVSGKKDDTAIYAVTVYNNTKNTYVYTGAEIGGDSLTASSFTGEDGNTVMIPSNEGDGYVSGTPIAPGETFEFYVEYTVSKKSDVTVTYNFEPVIYTITYINNGETLDTRCVYDNSGAVSTENAYAAEAAMVGITDESIKFKAWINAGSTAVTSVKEINTEDVELFPSYENWYTAMFVTQGGELLDWMMFTTGQKEELLEFADETKKLVPETVDLTFDYWVVQVKNADGTDSTITLDEYTSGDELPKNDITIYPAYKYNGDVNLIPIDSDGDGDIEYYQVDEYSDPNGQALVVIPSEVNGVKVTEINADAFASYDGVHAVTIPNEVTYIGANAFADAWEWGSNGETVTLYYAGSREDWITNEPNFDANWESGLSGDSRIFFLNGTDKVDLTQGYLQGSISGMGSNKTLSWTTYDTIPDDIVAEHTGYCNCDLTTTGDTAHIYVDADGNVMGRNDEGTPVNSEGTVIYLEKSGNLITGYTYTLTDGTNTYYRYRPDAIYWSHTIAAIVEETS